MDLDQQVGAPRAWTFAGREWLVSGLTPYQLGKLTAWLKDHVPNPLQEVKALIKDGVFTAEERKALIDEAKARAEPKYQTFGERTVQVSGWPPQFGSAEASAVLFNGSGIPAFLHVILSKHQPDLTPAEAEALAPLFTVEDLRALIDLIGVGGPDDEDEEDGDGDGPAADLPEGYVDPKA